MKREEALNNIKNIFIRETNAYFNSAAAYIVIIVFLLITGWFFISNVFLVNQAVIEYYTLIIPLLYTFFIPAITMRLFSEEFKLGTIETLVTLPVEDYEIILGKYLSSLLFLAVALALTFIYPILISFFGNMDWGNIIGSYIGLFMLGATFLSIGLFSSSVTKNQIIAFIVGFIICFAFFMIGKVLNFVPSAFVSFVEYIGIDSHYNNAMRGIIDTRDMLYHLSIITFFGVLTLYFLGKRKWN